MTTATAYLHNAESWLDQRGKGAWIAAMVLGFIVFWPVGLALLFYMIWSNRMSCSKKHSRWGKSYRRTYSRSSGNSAFDAYRDETIRRLEEEQEAFHAFMERLRNARDKAEFDQFMNERRDNPRQDDMNGDQNGPGTATPQSA
ncbi:DUF2852 domain-containing protein [Pontivivens ytuae]|uniref:DUF2852 domain-containing protein n=1 Tax=Pontivivens ytuae TaxID=2789856 RepID=A0A7S9LSD0_9RHOB|nr:DUF2852 domain-containing protein [Pontivivens ytuae]QPH53835.1 DUF2852 domain-containing protein [Pontivivens ytuae]